MLLIALCIFLQIEGNPALCKYIGPIFPKVFAYFVSLCHILIILVIFQAFNLVY